MNNKIVILEIAAWMDYQPTVCAVTTHRKDENGKVIVKFYYPKSRYTVARLLKAQLRLFDKAMK